MGHGLLYQQALCLQASAVTEPLLWNPAALLTLLNRQMITHLNHYRTRQKIAAAGDDCGQREKPEFENPQKFVLRGVAFLSCYTQPVLLQ
jgi:hypothetical protein